MNDEYIGRNALLKKLALRLNQEDGKDFCTPDMVFVMGTIMHEPAADVVEVVRCKDCKYSGEDDFDGSLWCCRDAEREVVEKHFCSYGERRGE